MEGTLLLGLGTSFIIEQVIPDSHQLIIAVRSATVLACCPLCASSSERSHSYYQRTVADLPCSGLRVTLKLTVRRFFCDNQECQRRIFAERFPDFLLPHAQMSNRLREALRTLSFATSAQAAARLAPYLGMKTSPTTLLRCQKADLIVSPPDVLKKVGLDDFAFRRGKSWGTIVINLETHQVVDLLPDRSVPTVVAWLLAHPSIELISRDRGSDYITAANQGASQAVQVCDRWHLLRNLSEFLELFLARMRKQVRKASHLLALQSFPEEERCHEAEGVGPDLPIPFKRSRIAQTRYQMAREVKRKEKQDKYDQVLELRAQNLSRKEVARRVGVSERTIRSPIAAQGAEPRQRRRRKSPLDAYVGYIQKRLQEGCQVGSHLHQELKDRGHQGSVTALYRYLDRMHGMKPGYGALPPSPLASHPGPFDDFHAKQAVWLFFRDPQNLSAVEKEQVKFLQTVHPSLEQAYQLVQQFVQMVRTHQAEPLDCWLEEVRNSQISELIRFGKGIGRDKAAVQAALALPYSNGVVEGHVHRLKFIKRMGYGRASFPLLRQRVLYQAA